MDNRLLQRAILIVLIGSVVILTGWRQGEREEPENRGKSYLTTPVVVPEGDGAPVITDGIFTAGEWDDGIHSLLREGTELWLKQYRSVVYIGIRGRIGPSEMFLAVPGGPIYRFHVSAQLSEAVLPASGPAPGHRFGFTADWYANELRRDEEEMKRLQKENKTPMEIIQATSYPCDGIEFAVRRSKLGGNVWLMRLHLSGIFDNKPGMFIYPPATEERATEGWLPLRLKQ